MDDKAIYRPGEPTVSKLRFYSVGIVAANKALSSHIIEVLPQEELTMMDGYLNDNKDTHTVTGVDDEGKHYSSKATTANTLQAEWIRLGDSNRITSPDVRRGEEVVIYQFGDADKYYWDTRGNDNSRRKLETVVWAISATAKEGDSFSASTSYYIEWSSHTKTITLHTSQANGEKWGYDLQINADTGYIVFKDTNGNFMKLDSLAESLRMQNASGSVIDITKQVASISTADQINFTAPKGSWTASSTLVLASPNLVHTR